MNKFWMTTLSTIAIFSASAPAFALPMQDEVVEFSDQQLEHFENKIRPILVARCAECHGKDAEQPGGGLLITSRGRLLAGGDTGPAIVPGSPDESLLIESIHYGGDYEMPPDSKMPDAEIELLEAWVADGAPWPAHDEDEGEVAGEEFDLASRKESHWCWNPLRVPALPAVNQKGWALDPLDLYILSAMEAAGVTPASEADKATWLRRVSFDLTGLPPTVSEWEAFRDDDSAQAYERVVDRLLNSPQFGERWARHWLDLMRYAETCGHEFDYPIPNAHQYRDYLIRAFNADVPYNQFVTEHLAGDLLEQPRLNPERKYNESVIATGFWFLGEATHAPVDVKGDEAGRVDNQLDVMSKSFLGLTVACARCHDHKFDAISTKDYYALSGFLQSSRRQEAMLDPELRIAEAQAAWNQVNVQAAEKLDAALQSRELRAALESELLALTRLYSGQAAQQISTLDQQTLAQLFAADAPAEDLVDVLVADFEDGTYGDWVAEGDAFGRAPQEQATLANYQGDVKASGRYFVNSHSRRAEDGGNTDASTGTLTSPPFEISRRYLKFLVGGGPHADRTCVQVLVGDQVVASQTGFAQNEMRPVQLDLEAHVGQQARLRIVDQETGGWGNIGADHFVLSNQASSDAPQRTSRLWARLAGMEAERVDRWQASLAELTEQPVSHPLGSLAAASRRWQSVPLVDQLPDAERTRDAFEAQRRETADRVKAFADARSNWVQNSSPLLNRNEQGEWQIYSSGQAFDRMYQADGWRFDGRFRPVAIDTINSSNGSPRAWGVIHSPEFTIDGNAIWYRLRGADVELRLVIDSYTMHIYSGLLFSDLTKRFDTQGKWQWIGQAGDLSRYQGHRAHFEIIDHSGQGFELSEVRLSRSVNPPEPVSPLAQRIADPNVASDEWGQRLVAEVMASLDRVTSHQATLDDVQVVEWLIDHRLIALPESLAMEHEALAQAGQRALDSTPNPMLVQAILDGSGENESVFIRGNHRLLGEVAVRRDLEAICDGQWPELPGSGRLEWAQSITSTSHPLTSRVIVNRLWHHLFGRGIVATVDNFGVLGAPPTHPELLDHLAISFMDDGWSLKRMMKRMVLSRTYRQSSLPNVQAEELDPTNRLWHRMEVRRLQGESIRDAMLAVSGRIDLTPYGPPVSVHLTEFMQGRGRPGASGPEDGNRRRSIYLEVRRNFLSPMMLAFDTPIPFSTVGRRNTSNVPAQALILLNDPFVQHEAEHWARRLIETSADSNERITRAFLEAFTREPSAEEIDRIQDFLAAQGAELGIPHEQQANHLQLWSNLCHALWNAKEFSYLR